MQRSRSGFTLIELLVVIAIIAILAAILFPVLVQAKERGRSASCQSNLKQIFNACRMYADDWGGYLPWSCIRINGVKYYWQDGAWVPGGKPPLWKYLASTVDYQGRHTKRSPLDCPSRRSVRDYTANALIFPYQYLNTAEMPFASLDSITGPRKIIMVADMIEGAEAYQMFDMKYWPATRIIAARHGEKGNCLFADGHVGQLQPLSITPNQVDWRL